MGRICLDNSIETFLKYSHEIRTLSNYTIYNYRRDLMNLNRFCNERKIYHIENISEADIRDWIGALNRRGLAKTSIQRYLSTARSFFNHLIRENALEKNPTTSIFTVRKPRKLPKILDVDQLAKLFENNKKTFLGIRDLAIAELFYSSGIRLSELVSIDIGDLSIKSSKI